MTQDRGTSSPVEIGKIIHHSDTGQTQRGGGRRMDQKFGVLGVGDRSTGNAQVLDELDCHPIAVGQRHRETIHPYCLA
jgi:hypothetical protein